MEGSLAGYGERIYAKYHHTCVYCGYDGRGFDGWMQLSIDHLRPRSSGGDDSEENLVVACRSCNSITSRMTFEPDTPLEAILAAKRERVDARRAEFYDFWLKNVAPAFLKRPLPPVL